MITSIHTLIYSDDSKATRAFASSSPRSPLRGSGHVAPLDSSLPEDSPSRVCPSMSLASQRLHSRGLHSAGRARLDDRAGRGWHTALPAYT